MLRRWSLGKHNSLFYPTAAIAYSFIFQRDASDAPVNITNKIGRVLLRKAGMTLPGKLSFPFLYLKRE